MRTLCLICICVINLIFPKGTGIIVFVYRLRLYFYPGNSEKAPVVKKRAFHSSSGPKLCKSIEALTNILLKKTPKPTTHR